MTPCACRMNDHIAQYEAKCGMTFSSLGKARTKRDRELGFDIASVSNHLQQWISQYNW